MKSKNKWHNRVPDYRSKIKWHERIPGYRSKKKWKMIIASLFYVWIFISFVSVLSEEESPQPINETSAEKQEVTNETDDESTSTKDETQTNSSEQEYTIGDSVKVGKLEYVINDVKTTDTVGPEYMSETTDEAFLVVNVSITNNAKEAQFIEYEFLKLFNGDTEYSPNGDAIISANDEMDGESSFILDEANPGSTLTGNVVFEVVPEVAESDNLQMRVEAGDFATTTELISLK
ncbi:DUF4352 domain-containing protein [Marinococcus luteus]|uniref:DUF4352 domain-containing protein n=1 Tax=Marinococcus luteus TaxID=1122204 RepID=UPI002ACCE1C5|nr:DUF4352 domain-containing protein [Marinococcus luteus]MDZ5781899.1 DUF4352 domain-containing protein [Marinococcus luteus]